MPLSHRECIQSVHYPLKSILYYIKYLPCKATTCAIHSYLCVAIHIKILWTFALGNFYTECIQITNISIQNWFCVAKIVSRSLILHQCELCQTFWSRHMYIFINNTTTELTFWSCDLCQNLNWDADGFSFVLLIISQPDAALAVL